MGFQVGGLFRSFGALMLIVNLQVERSSKKYSI